MRRLLAGRIPQNDAESGAFRSRKSLWGGLYFFAFAVVLSLIGFDLVMSMDPHWVSTLFGAYHFVKAFYVGLGALIILAAIVHLRRGGSAGIAAAHFHDIGKLFLRLLPAVGGFFLRPADGDLVRQHPRGDPLRDSAHDACRPGTALAWTVFIMCFIIPFLVLINKRVKTMPGFMMALCGMVIVGMWLEHLLLLGPA